MTKRPETNLDLLRQAASHFTTENPLSTTNQYQELSGRLKGIRVGIDHCNNIIDDKDNEGKKIAELVKQINQEQNGDKVKEYRDQIFNLIGDNKFLKNSYYGLIADQTNDLSKKMSTIEGVEEVESSIRQLKNKPFWKKLFSRKADRNALGKLTQQRDELDSQVGENTDYDSYKTQLCRILYNSDFELDGIDKRYGEIIISLMEAALEKVKLVKNLLEKGPDHLDKELKIMIEREIKALIPQLTNIEKLQLRDGHNATDREQLLDDTITAGLFTLVEMLDNNPKISTADSLREIESLLKDSKRKIKSPKLSKQKASEADNEVKEFDEQQDSADERRKIFSYDIDQLSKDLADLSVRVVEVQDEDKKESLDNTLSRLNHYTASATHDLRSLQHKPLHSYFGTALSKFVELCTTNEEVFLCYQEDRAMESISKKSGIAEGEGFNCTAVLVSCEMICGEYENRKIVPLAVAFPDFCDYIKSDKHKYEIVKEVNERKKHQQPTIPRGDVKSSSYSQPVQSVRSDSYDHGGYGRGGYE